MYGRWQIEVSASAQAQLGARDLSDPRTFEVAETGHVTVRTDGWIRSSLGNAQTPSPSVTWAGLSLGLAMCAFNIRRCRLGIAPSDFSMPISSQTDFSIVVKKGAAACRARDNF